MTNPNKKGHSMKTITVFTTNTCAYCKLVKKWFDNKGIKYSTVNLDEHPERQQEIYEKSGALTVPVTLINDGETESVIIGFNIAKMASMV